jgi:hypothetical protein
MLSSMTIQPGANTAFFCSSFSSQIPSFRPFKTSLFMMPKAFSLHSCTILDQSNKPIRRNQNVTVSAAPEALTAEIPSETESSTSTSSEEPKPSQQIEVQFTFSFFLQELIHVCVSVCVFVVCMYYWFILVAS